MGRMFSNHETMLAFLVEQGGDYHERIYDPLAEYAFTIHSSYTDGLSLVNMVHIHHTEETACLDAFMRSPYSTVLRQHLFYKRNSGFFSAMQRMQTAHDMALEHSADITMEK